LEQEEGVIDSTFNHVKDYSLQLFLTSAIPKARFFKLFGK